MPKLTHSQPSYRRHKGSGQAVVTICGRDYYLGKWRSRASKRHYDRLIAEWLARDRQPLVEASDLTVVELASRYWAYAKRRHVRRGQPSARQFHVRSALQRLLRLYVDHLAVSFGPVELKVVRESMIGAGWPLISPVGCAGCGRHRRSRLRDATAAVDDVRRGRF